MCFFAHFFLLKNRSLLCFLLNGHHIDRWGEENGTLEQNCLFRVHSYGFFISWQSEGRDEQVINRCFTIRISLFFLYITL
jgi:hypothetical protein